MTEKPKKPESTNLRIRRTAVNVIMVCLALIVVVSGIKVFTIIRDYRANQAVYDKVSEQAQKDGFTGDIDFDALRAINPDVVGWLYYEDTPVNYPVVQGTDNDKYLNTMFDGTWGSFGTLFVDSVTEAPFRQFNTIVYGHHMKDGSMFAPLKQLKSSSYAKEHPQLELITPEGKFHLVIWAFLNQPADSQIYVTNIHDKTEREEYLKLIEDLADYTTDVNVTVDDRLVILSTCAYEYQDARYMVVGKMVPWKGQKINMSYDEPDDAEAEADTDTDAEAGGEDE